MCGSPVTVKELDSKVDVMQRCLTEGGNSIPSFLSMGALASKAVTEVTRFSGS